MKYATPLKLSQFDRVSLQKHETRLRSQIQEDLRRGIYKKDYVVSIEQEALSEEMQAWLEGFGVDYRLKSYLMMMRAWHEETIYHYIEFNTDEVRMLYKLAWGGR
jgi:hypothetical protein